MQRVDGGGVFSLFKFTNVKKRMTVTSYSQFYLLIKTTKQDVGCFHIDRLIITTESAVLNKSMLRHVNVMRDPLVDFIVIPWTAPGHYRGQ